jgi:hypothetical protein
MPKFFKDMVTGTSNLDYELSRVLWLVGASVYLGAGVYHMARNAVFDPAGFGAGFGAIMLGAGFGTAAKDKAKNEAVTPPAATQVLATGPISATVGEG